MLIDQAIFTSARTRHGQGYHLVATSPGVSSEESQELSAWGPSHDSLLAKGPLAESLNFQALSSGRYCVSQTTAAGNEYSDRGGHRVYTQCLLVPASDFARFAHNPFAVARAALAKGVLNVYEQVPPSLAAIQLAGRAAPLEVELIKRLASDFSLPTLCQVLQAVVRSTGCVGVVGAANIGPLLAGVLNCLPVGCRSEISFSTGLTYSQRRSFRLMALPDDATTLRRLMRQQGVTVVDVRETKASGALPTDGWAGYVASMLSAGTHAPLTAELDQHSATLGLAQLDDLGNRLLGSAGAPRPTTSPDARQPAATASDGLQQAHAAHSRFVGSKTAASPAPSPKSAATVSAPTGPARQLGAQSPAALDLLEQLDDAVFDAISGKTEALEQLRHLWPRVLAEVGPDMVGESKEQYLLYTLSTWSDAASEALREPNQAANVLDVLCLLFEEGN